MEVSFAHVDFSYGNRVILKDFCADWKAGICHYIVGAVGSGKTTLMKLVTAMLLPRGAVCIVKAVVFGLVLPKLCARVRRALPGEGEKTHGA